MPAARVTLAPTDGRRCAGLPSLRDGTPKQRHAHSNTLIILEPDNHQPDRLVLGDHGDAAWGPFHSH